MAGVDLDAAVGRVERGRASGGPAAGRRAGSGRRARRPGCGRAACPVGGSTGWWWSTCSWAPSTSCISRASWPQEASSRLSASAAVVSSARRTTGGRAPILLPQRGRGVEEEDVDLAAGRRARAGRRGGRPAAASGRTARGARGGRRASGSARSRSHAGSSRSAGSARPSRCAQPPPQLRLPRGLVGSRLAARPAAHHRRPVQRVAVEQLGEVADGREAARAAVGVVLGAEVDRRGCAATARRRHSPTTSSSGQTARCGSHGSVSGSIAGRGRDGVADEPARERELDVRADAVGPAGRGAEARRHPLREPALHASGGHGDDVGRERVGERLGQEPARAPRPGRRRVQLGGCAAWVKGVVDGSAVTLTAELHHACPAAHPVVPRNPHILFDASVQPPRCGRGDTR